jgi:hypothetical protein
MVYSYCLNYDNDNCLEICQEDIICPTPTPTATSTPTPTPTATSTPTPTPTATPIIIPRKPNECSPITLLPVGVSCIGSNPTSVNVFNGSVCLQITGGTAPYSIFWYNNGQLITNQSGICIYGLSAGTYSSIVTDYYKDFTATTSCELVNPIIPTPTPTPTPTQTQIPTYDPICMIIDCGNIGQWTFNSSLNYVNGKPTWTGTGVASNYYISWDTSVSPNRWLVNGFNNFNIMSNVSSLPPISGWYTEGEQYDVVVNNGECTGEIPIQFHTVTTNPTCQGQNNGSISVIVDCGNGPFQFSIDGISYTSNSIFTGLNSGTYNVYVKNNNSTVSQTVTLNSGGQQSVYILDLEYQTQQINNGNQITTFNVIVKDNLNNIITLPIGTTISFDIIIDNTFELYTPGDANNFLDTFEVKKNNIIQSVTQTTTTTNTTPRFDCVGQNKISTNNVYKYSLTMTNLDVISGTVVSSLVITNPQIVNGCATMGVDLVNVYLDNVNKNCTCCDIQENAQFNIENMIQVEEIPTSCFGNYRYRITNTSIEITDVQYFTSCNGKTTKVVIYNVEPNEIIFTDGVTIRPSSGQSYPCAIENSISGIQQTVTIELLGDCDTIILE